MFSEFLGDTEDRRSAMTMTKARARTRPRSKGKVIHFLHTPRCATCRKARTYPSSGKRLQSVMRVTV